MTKRLLPTLLAFALIAGCGGSCKRFLYEGFGRDDWQQPDRVLAELAIEAGDHIADIGTGGGYFTFKFAEATGGSGVVYAVDIDPDMVSHIKEVAEEKNMPQVRAVLAEPDNPGLPSGTIDLVFLSNTYHHIQDRAVYFSRLREALAPGGHVAIVEYRNEGLFHSLFGHATEADEIRSEMTEAGYQIVRELDYLEQQHFLILEPAGS